MTFTDSERREAAKQFIILQKEIDFARYKVNYFTEERNFLSAVDESYGNIFTNINNLVNNYQNELDELDGNLRTKITESNILSGGYQSPGNVFNLYNKVNYFYPKMYNAYGEGKTEAGSYLGTVNGEEYYYNRVVNYIDTLMSVPRLQRITGRTCAGDDITVNNTVTENFLTRVTDLRDYYNNTLLSKIYIGDSEATRKSQSIISRDTTTSAINDLNDWLSITSYYWDVSIDTCLEYNSISLTEISKFNNTQLNSLSSFLFNKRQFSTVTRIPQINLYLGNIIQNTTYGYITNATGLYGGRGYVLNSRMNAKAGVLIKKKYCEEQIVEWSQILISYIDSLSTYYSNYTLLQPMVEAVPLVLSSPIFLRFNNFTNVIAQTASYFTPGEFVYLTCDDLPELYIKILDIRGNKITFANQIPFSYTISKYDYPRIYKVNNL